MKFDGERIIPDLPELSNLYQIHLATYRFISDYMKDKRVLDVGCGCGYGSYLIATKGANEVIGVDRDRQALEYAKQNYHSNNLSFKYLDLLEDNALKNQKFDAVTSFQVLEHIEDNSLYLSTLSSFLNAGGFVYISTPNRLIYSPKSKKPSNPYHYKEYSPVELAEILNNYFDDLEIWGQKITNQEYQEYENNLRRKVKTAPYWLRKWIPSFITAPIIKKLKGRNPVQLKPEEIILTKQDITSAPIMIAMGRKKEK